MMPKEAIAKPIERPAINPISNDPLALQVIFLLLPHRFTGELLLKALQSR